MFLDVLVAALEFALDERLQSQGQLFEAFCDAFVIRDSQKLRLLVQEMMSVLATKPSSYLGRLNNWCALILRFLLCHRNAGCGVIHARWLVHDDYVEQPAESFQATLQDAPKVFNLG